jgi:hypothetical protein
MVPYSPALLGDALFFLFASLLYSLAAQHYTACLAKCTPFETNIIINMMTVSVSSGFYFGTLSNCDIERTVYRILYDTEILGVTSQKI